MLPQRLHFRVGRTEPRDAASALAQFLPLRGSRRTLLPWCVAAALAFAPGVSRAQTFTLGTRIDLPTGANPARVAVGDLNGDGRPDLVVSNYSGSSVSVFLGVSPGLFGPRTDYPTDGFPIGVAIADLNGDGTPDLVVAGLSGISILAGNGAGGFLPHNRIMPGLAAFSVAVGDLNGDGRPDIVVGVDENPNPGEVGVVLADGQGGFGPPRLFADGVGEQTSSVALGDINGDGILDLAITNLTADGIAVMLGDGRGGFGPAVDLLSEPSSYSVALADLDNDGILDYAVSSDFSPGGSISIGFGNGSGGFGFDATMGTGVGGVPGVAVADLNHDGFADLVAINVDSSQVLVLRGSGTHSFSNLTKFATGQTPTGVLAADVDGDGRLDIVTANGSANTVSILLGSGGGAFAAKSDVPAGLNPSTAAIGDLNGDGIPDLVLVSQAANGVSVLFGNGSGGFSSRTDLPATGGPRGVAIADLNGDGAPDLVVGNAAASNVSYYLNNGVGGFGPRVDLAAGSDPLAVAVGDINGDGLPDIVTANKSSNNVSVLLGTGGSGFAPHADFTVGASPNAIALADENGDGKKDVLVANTNSNTVSILYTGVASLFPSGISLPTGSVPYAVAFGDFNQDGKSDFAVVEGAANTVSVQLYTGIGTFGPRVSYPTGPNPASVAVADINGDGRLDLIVGNSTTPGTVSVLLGDGTGKFGPRTDYPVGPSPFDVEAGDLNGDGRPDIVCMNRTATSASILLALRATRSRVAASPNPVVRGAGVVLTANVYAITPGGPALGDSVAFFDGTTLLGSAPVLGGVASLGIAATRLGVRPISARFAGNGHYSGSFAPAIGLDVVPTAAPAISSIADVRNDQGDELRLRFRKSPFDYPGSMSPIAHYDVYRQVAPGSVASRAARNMTSIPARATAAPEHVELDGWDFVATTPATTDSAYDLVVSTLADSNASGIHEAVFLVRAQTATPGVAFDSAPDSGYAVDNLSPAPPEPLTAAYSAGATHLHWGAGTEPDLWYYRLYRGSSAGFTPGPGNQIASTSDTGYVDVGPAGSYYKLSAVDVNGNESAYTLLSPGGTLGVDEGPVAFALERLPNPVVGARLNVNFSLPSGERATLEMTDVSGRTVVRKDVGALGAGRHAVTLADGEPLPAGIYFIRLTQGRQGATLRVTVLR